MYRWFKDSIVRSKKSGFRQTFSEGEQISLYKIIISQNSSTVSVLLFQKLFTVVSAI